MDITQGTWNNPAVPLLKLPDFGITEKIQDIFNSSTGNTGYNPVITNPNQRPIGLDYTNATVPAGTTGSTPISKIPNLAGTIKTTPNPTNISSSGSGFDMKYYPGWDPTAARADWVATGGSKANVSTGGTTTPPVPTKQTNITKVGTDKGGEVALDYANYADQMSPEQYYAMIDQEAGNSQNFLNQQEAGINADKKSSLANLEKQRATNKETAYTTKEDAQTAARRLYGELQQGYRQRFGGASSAGEAAQALTNVEQQRQMAANNRTYQNAVTQVDTSADSAIASAQSEFRNQLLEVNRNRTAVESERLAARRQALSDLSKKVFAIQQQRETFKQNLQLMQEQARLSNKNNLSSLSTNPTSNLTFNNASTTASGNTGLNSAIGSINKTSTGVSKNEDVLSNGVYPIASMIDGRTKYSDGSIR